MDANEVVMHVVDRDSVNMVFRSSGPVFKPAYYYTVASVRRLSTRYCIR
jgi:hypothetical protein